MNGIGDKFVDFMKEDGIHDEAKTLAIKELLVFQFEKEMSRQKLTKTQLAKRMGISRTAIDHILEPRYNSTISSLEKFASALGKELSITVT